MKKKLVTLIIAVCTATALVGCGSGKISNSNVTIEQYKGLEVEKVAVKEVTEADIEESINSTLQAKSTTKDITDRAVAGGDIVTIDYVGKKDGVEFEGGSATDYDLTIGSGQFIDGFEDGIIGHNIGETFDLNLKFPEEYQAEDLAGKDVVFTVTLKAIKVKEVPELSDELVKEISEESKTIAEYEEEVKEGLKKSNKETAKSSEESKMWQALIKNCTVKEFPKKEKDSIIEEINAQYGQIASMYGMADVEEFVKQAFGMTVNDMAENTLKQRYAVELIAEKEKITVTDKEYKAGLKKYAKQFGYDDEAKFEEEVGKENLQGVLLQEEVAKFLMDNSKMVEAKEEKKEEK